MKETHTILIPMMLPIHFRLIKNTDTEGYKVDILDSMSHDVIATGVKYVNNDMCYPAQLAIGQLLDGAMNHGYDTHKIALLLTQTGGGCRASNYIALLRKALKRAGLEYIPVLSFNVVGLEDNPGFKLTKTLLKNAMFAIIYGDMIMNLKNQILPYALDKDEVSATVDRVCSELERQFEAGHGCTRKELRKNCPWILGEFAQIKTVSGQKKTKVGIVGEIYVKFAPLGNNNLEAFLEKEDCEVVVPGLMDFVLYTADAGIEDWYLYGTGHTKAVVSKFIVNYIVSLQNTVIDSYKNYPQFKPQTPFKHTKALSKKVSTRAPRWAKAGCSPQKWSSSSNPAAKTSSAPSPLAVCQTTSSAAACCARSRSSIHRPISCRSTTTPAPARSTRRTASSSCSRRRKTSRIDIRTTSNILLLEVVF